LLLSRASFFHFTPIPF